MTPKNAALRKAVARGVSEHGAIAEIPHPERVSVSGPYMVTGLHDQCESEVISSLGSHYRCERAKGHEGDHLARTEPLRDGRREPINWNDQQAQKYGPKGQ